MILMFGLLISMFTRTESGTPYECRHCGQRFSVQHHCCPECESYSVERVVWPTATS
jgi:lipopolysaccharide biosynthesis regulator YciM